MESAFFGKAGKKLFEKHLQQYAPADPLYETYTNKKGKTKRRKRALPPGLSARDARILKSVQRRAHHLDKGLSVLGMRFGYTFVIGLIPVLGDVGDIALNYALVVRPAQGADIPPWLLRRMLLNNAVSAAVGAVPVVGDVGLAAFKANSRNAALLEEFLRIRGEEFIRLGGSVEPEAGRSGWFGGKKQKKGKARKGALEDVQQVKPGAGMSGAEMKEALPPAAKKPSFAFFGNGRHKKPTSEPVPASGANGRFVENLDSKAAPPVKN